MLIRCHSTTLQQGLPSCICRRLMCNILEYQWLARCPRPTRWVEAKVLVRGDSLFLLSALLQSPQILTPNFITFPPRLPSSVFSRAGRASKFRQRIKILIHRREGRANEILLQSSSHDYCSVDPTLDDTLDGVVIVFPCYRN